MFSKMTVYGLNLALLLCNCLPVMAFQAKQGEVLEYKVIAKSVIPSGTQTVKILDNHENYKGQAAIRIRSTITTTGLVNQLYHFYQSEEMLLDASGLYPLYLKRESRDRKGTEFEEVSFDYRKKVAVRRVIENDKPEERTEITLPGFVQDALSLQFFLRKTNLKPGNHQLFFYSNGSGSIKEIDYSVQEIRKSLKAGEQTYQGYLDIQCPKVNITVRISNDEARHPLLIRQLTKLGKLEAQLVKAQ
jgi:hypothetical protein